MKDKVFGYIVFGLMFAFTGAAYVIDPDAREAAYILLWLFPIELFKQAFWFLF